MPAPLVHLVTRKPLVNNARVFRQAGSLRRAGYDVLLLGVRRGPLPRRATRDGIGIIRVTHDPLPHRLSVWLRRGGHSPTTVRAAPGSGSSARRLAMRGARAAGPLPWLAQSLAFYVRAYRELARAPAPAVVHVSDLNALLVGALHARRHRCPLVYDAQELFTGMHALPRSYRALLARQERLLLRKVDRLIVVNPAIRDVMLERYGRRADAVVLNCPPFQDLVPEADIRTQLGFADGTSVIVYSGGLLPERGLEQTILALHHLPGVCLAILGEGDLRPSLEALVARERLTDRVRFRGFVPPREVPGFIQSADLGIVPYQDAGANHRLCSPSKLFHYLMAELPVAASDFPFLRAVVAGERVGTLFDPADPKSIAAGVSRILANPTAYRGTLASVRRRYCWEREEPRLLELYASLFTGSVRPQPAGAQAAPPRRPPSTGASRRAS